MCRLTMSVIGSKWIEYCNSKVRQSPSNIPEIPRCLGPSLPVSRTWHVWRRTAIPFPTSRCLQCRRGANVQAQKGISCPDGSQRLKECGVAFLQPGLSLNPRMAKLTRGRTVTPTQSTTRGCEPNPPYLLQLRIPLDHVPQQLQRLLRKCHHILRPLTFARLHFPCHCATRRTHC